MAKFSQSKDMDMHLATRLPIQTLSLSLYNLVSLLLCFLLVSFSTEPSGPVTELLDKITEAMLKYEIEKVPG